MPSPPQATARRRQLVAAFALLVVLAALTAFLAVTALVNVRQSRAWVVHSHAVIEAALTLFSDVQDVESGTRGFLTTGDPQFLDHYDGGRTAAPHDAARLMTLVKDNPPQAERARRFIALLNRRIDVAAMRVGLMRQGRMQEAHAALHGAGKSTMEQARSVMGELMAAERDLLDRRTAAADRAEWRGVVAALAVGGVAMLGVTLSLISIAAANRRLAHEIAERVAAEAAGRESEARYRAVFENAADLLFVIDMAADGAMRMDDVNPAFEQATGLGAAEVRGQEVTPLSSDPVRKAQVQTYVRRVAAGGKPVFTRHTVTIQDDARLWETRLAPVRNDAGVIDRVIGSSRDVTDREAAEKRLRDAQRMEAIGHLTGGVAHDFNNLLQVVRGNLELIAADVVDRARTAQRVRQAIHGADRAAQLTRQLLAFARRQPLEPKVLNLGRLVTDMAEMLRRTLGESVEVETVTAGGLWNTLADPAQVESAILNLAINARDAMPEGGRLTIEITNAVLDESYVAHEPEVQPGQYVLLAVSDSGEGMAPETLAKVFEPFFTTKSEEKGTGLGLSMVYGFVKQSHGHIQIYSEVGHGTTVKIYLPRSRQKEVAAPAPPPAAIRGHGEVILMVDDDDLVRASVAGMLSDLGYECVQASDAAAALDHVTKGGRVDLLFTDVVMPGPVKATTLAAEAQRLRPGLPVLFTSGYTDNAIVHHGRLDPGVHLISKPYARDELARRLRALLRPARVTVLVVEDDPLVRMAAADMIEQLGFHVEQAADAEQALARLADGRPVELLFTDVGLPGMRGPELARAARELRPGLKVVFASGYSDEQTELDGDARLGKPYEQGALAEVLRAALN